MQYAVISIHNALQGYMTIYLRHGDLKDTWKKSHANKWENIEYPRIESSQGIYQPKQFPQLDIFMKLFDKVTENQNQTVSRELINVLNENRNIFIHFNTDIYSLEKQYIVDALAEALKLVNSIISMLGSQLFNKEEFNEIKMLCEKAQLKIDEIQPPNKRLLGET